MIAGRSSRGVKNFDQFNRLRLQFCDPFRRNQGRPFRKFNPKIRFISLFENGRDFVDEIRMGFSPEHRTVVRGNGAPAARDLAGNCLAGRFVRQCVGNLENSDGELKGPFFKFDWIHGYSGVG